MIKIYHSDKFNSKELKELFDSVGWAHYLSAEMLLNAIQHSSHYVSARMDGKLVGIIRCMDDNIWSANIDCLVVHSLYQKQGIASLLIKELLQDISHIKYVNVMPDSSENFKLYTKNGFNIHEESRLLQLTQIKEE